MVEARGTYVLDDKIRDQAVEQVDISVNVFKSEIDCVMAQLGYKSILDIGRSVVDTNVHVQQMRK